MKTLPTRIALAIILIALPILIVSCGTSSFHSHQLTRLDRPGYDRLLVMMPAPDKRLVALVEHGMASALAENGQKGICSIDQQQEHPENTDTPIGDVATDAGAEAVLFVLPLDYSAPPASANSRFFLPKSGTSPGWRQVPISGKVSDLAVASESTTAGEDSTADAVGVHVPDAFELWLYDLDSGKRVWSATSGVDWGKKDAPDAVSQQLAAKTVKELKKSRLIP